MGLFTTHLLDEPSEDSPRRCFERKGAFAKARWWSTSSGEATGRHAPHAQASSSAPSRSSFFVHTLQQSTISKAAICVDTTITGSKQDGTLTADRLLKFRRANSAPSLRFTGAVREVEVARPTLLNITCSFAASRRTIGACVLLSVFEIRARRLFISPSSPHHSPARLLRHVLFGRGVRARYRYSFS